MGFIFDNNENISILTSHLIIGYEPFSLITKHICFNKCFIKNNFKFIENNQNKLNEKTFLNFLKNLSFLTCFYGILPGELTEIYLLTYFLIYFYITILIINEENQLNNLMKIFGLNSLIRWTARYLFDLILIQIYSFYLLLIFSINFQECKLNHFQNLIYENNRLIKNIFYSINFIITASTLPFIYILTSLFLFFIFI